MYQEEKPAYINAQVACALIELESMKAFNAERISKGLSPGYSEEAFLALIDKYNISHNAVMRLLEER